MDSDYRQLHEQFVSNHNGTTTNEILVITSYTFLLPLLAVVLSTRLAENSPNLKRFLIEFALIAIPVIAIVTVLEAHFTTLFSLTILALLLASIPPNCKFFIKDSFFEELRYLLHRPSDGTSKELVFLTEYKSAMLLSTAITILAVDFQVFPRRFAKTETFGYGLMDLGVGSFVFCNGLVSPESRFKLNKVTTNVKKSVISSLPLLVLGFLRLLTTSAIGYQQHVTEYGVHWNFFFTIAAVKISSSVLFCCISSSHAGIMGIVLMLFVQTLLTMCQFDVLLLESGPRIGLIYSNKEGLFSCLGSLSIYLIGISVGQRIFMPRKYLLDWLSLLFKFTLFAILAWIGEYISANYIQKSSRRMNNLTYILWMIAENASLLCVALFINIAKDVTNLRHTSIKSDPRSSSIVKLPKSIIMEAINYNGLLFFLLANLLTGCINLSIQTLFAPPLLSLFVLTAYTLVLASISVLLHIRRIKLKIW